MTDRGTEYCGRVDMHDDQLFLAINGIDHTKTKVKSSQTNGICERFHKTVLHEFYQVAFRKRLYDSVHALHAVLDQWLHQYNHERTHQGDHALRQNAVPDHDRGQRNLEGKVRELNLT